ncbi:MAG: chemotaxis protein CheC [Oscillospiraceae bacterium]|nr:chemotaxis protein CheC [Oscillospiraceae bacterium]
MKNYDELSSLELDTLREIGSMGTGNAATALSQMLGREVRITLPEVRIMGYNEAIEWIGGPEEITAGVLSGLAGMDVTLTVPAFTVDMQGAILAVPMAEYGGQSDYIMTIGGNFVFDNQEVPCRLLMSPDLRSLNALLRKLGVSDE